MKEREWMCAWERGGIEERSSAEEQEQLMVMGKPKKS
jgi:hypothetical protein